MMRYILFFVLLVLLTPLAIYAQTNNVQLTAASEVLKVEAAPEKGFTYPYYLYVSPELKNEKKELTILVLPNNTGKTDDDFAVHESDVKRRISQVKAITSNLPVIVLMPVFPRPKTDWQIYTHALDRDAMMTDKKEYRRFDLQLVAMIEHARAKLAAEKLKTDKQIFISGFSASGMFANRFAFLHPNLVKAAAIGSPGGLAIAPAESYKEKSLRYPIGIADFKDISGTKFDKKNVRKVPLFIFIGDKDTNDSVLFGDSYEEEDKNLIFELFGKTPVERWEITRKIYEENKLNAEFKMYPNVAHTVNKEMRDDITAFFAKHLDQ